MRICHIQSARSDDRYLSLSRIGHISATESSHSNRIAARWTHQRAPRTGGPTSLQPRSARYQVSSRLGTYEVAQESACYVRGRVERLASVPTSARCPCRRLRWLALPMQRTLGRSNDRRLRQWRRHAASGQEHGAPGARRSWSTSLERTALPGEAARRLGTPSGRNSLAALSGWRSQLALPACLPRPACPPRLRRPSLPSQVEAGLHGPAATPRMESHRGCRGGTLRRLARGGRNPGGALPAAPSQVEAACSRRRPPRLRRLGALPG